MEEDWTWHRKGPPKVEQAQSWGFRSCRYVFFSEAGHKASHAFHEHPRRWTAAKVCRLMRHMTDAQWRSDLSLGPYFRFDY